MNIHARLSDGEIVGYGNAEVAPADGCAVFTFPTHCIPKPDLHKIDVEYGALIDKTPDEQALALLPSDSELRAAIYQELNHSDQFTVPDRPMPAEQRAAWPIYRQALRDLSKLPTSSAMVKAWPLRPDGADAIPHLRLRVK